MLHQLVVLGSAGLAVFLAAKQMFPDSPTKTKKDDLAKAKLQKSRLDAIKRREQTRAKTRL